MVLVGALLPQLLSRKVRLAKLTVPPQSGTAQLAQFRIPLLAYLGNLELSPLLPHLLLHQQTLLQYKPSPAGSLQPGGAFQLQQ